MEKTNKAFTIRITNNETGEEDVINTDAIIGGYVTEDGGTAFHKFNGTVFDVSIACSEATRALENAFEQNPECKMLATLFMAKRKKESEEKVSDNES